jgi:O-antigen/teichoic acid export membrane protein
MTPVIIVGLFLMQPFLGWWIDTEFAAEAAFVGQIILLGLWANSLAIIPYVTLQAQGRPDLVAKAHLVEVLPYLAMLYIGLTHWGVAGAAWAWSLRVSLDALLLFILNGTARGLGKLFIMPMVLLSSAACSLWLAGSPTISLTAGLLTLAVCLLWCWRSLPATLSARLTKVLPKFNRPLKEDAP